MPDDTPKTPGTAASAKSRRTGAIALVVGLAALTAQASETDLVGDIQRYCTACWRNARLDPMRRAIGGIISLSDAASLSAALREAYAECASNHEPA